MGIVAAESRRDSSDSLSLSWLSIPGANPVQFVDAAAHAGFRAVSVRLAAPADGNEASVCDDPGAFNALQSALQGCDVRLAHMGGLWLDGRRRVADYEKALACGARLGTRRCVAIATPGRTLDAIRYDFSSLCELARIHQIRVAIEFGAYLGVASLDDAVTLVRDCATDNAGILIDALHLHRLGLGPQALTDIPPDMIDIVQLCDAKADVPAPWQLQTEARGGRLDPGHGVIPLIDLVNNTPKHTLLEVEAPCVAYRNITPRERAQLAMDAARQLLARCRLQ